MGIRLNFEIIKRIQPKWQPVRIVGLEFWWCRLSIGKQISLFFNISCLFHSVNPSYHTIVSLVMFLLNNLSFDKGLIVF